MSVSLRKNLPWIQILNNADPKVCKKILKTVPNEVILCLCEIINNYLHGNIPYSKKDLQKLKKYKGCLRCLASKTNDKRKNGIAKKRQLLIQNGGFLPAILTPLLSIAGGLLSSIIP